MFLMVKLTKSGASTTFILNIVCVATREHFGSKISWLNVAVWDHLRAPSARGTLDVKHIQKLLKLVYGARRTVLFEQLFFFIKKKSFGNRFLTGPLSPSRNRSACLNLEDFQIKEICIYTRVCSVPDEHSWTFCFDASQNGKTIYSLKFNIFTNGCTSVVRFRYTINVIYTSVKSQLVLKNKKSSIVTVINGFEPLRKFCQPQLRLEENHWQEFKHNHHN